MISDAKQCFLDIFTKQFFSCRKNFFLSHDFLLFFFTARKESLAPREKKFSRLERKMLRKFIKETFASKNIAVSEGNTD